MTVGLVVVSHSAPLAAALADLARAVSHSEVRIALAAGVDDPDHPLGTDAGQILTAIESVDSEAGVLVLMDLGSAVLSAELACDLLPAAIRQRVVLCEAPLVEGLVAAAVQASAGADLEQVATEARAGLSAKVAHLGAAPPDRPGVAAGARGSANQAVADHGFPNGTTASAPVAASVQLVVTNAHGLHARPAARIVGALAALDATVTIRNQSTNSEAAPASSLNGLITLGVRVDDRIEARAVGPDATRAVATLAALAASNFGEPERDPEGADEVATPAAVSADVLAIAGSPTDGSAENVAPGAEDLIHSDGIHGQGSAGVLRGLGASPGVAIGRVRLLPSAADAPRARRAADGVANDPEQEHRRLQAALDRAAAGLARTRRMLEMRGGGNAAAIVDVHGMLLADPALLDPAFTAISAGASAEDAWDRAVRATLDDYRDLDDPYLAGRAADVQSMGDEVLALLLADHTPGLDVPGLDVPGLDVPGLDVPGLDTLVLDSAVVDMAADAAAIETAAPDPSGQSTATDVLVGHDLTPSAASRLDPARVAAVVTEAGAPTSHAAILARALGIPAVVAVGPAALELVAGTPVIVDGDRGRVVLEPDAEAVAAATQRIAEDTRIAARARTAGRQSAITQDGVGVQVLANAGMPQDAARAHAEGADGIGLLRSELLFLDRSTAPGEEEQVAVYDAVCRAMDGKSVVLRTLDIGGDKPVPYVDVATEANPFLGDRGIRLTLARPILLRTQLRAALRVAADRPLRLMLPMVSTVAEIHAARALLEEARRSLCDQGVLVGGVQLGVMVEVPALALGIRHVLPEVDFVSIGTNDLTQYVMAAERGNPAVAHFADALEPAVLRLIAEVCEAASECGTPVAVCGGIAADPDAVPVLLGLGVRELSVPPPVIGTIKDRVRAVDVARATRLAREALAAADATAVRTMLRSDAMDAAVTM